MNTSDFDPSSLLQNASPSNVLSDAIAPLMTVFVVFTVVSIILTVAIVALWIFGLVQRRKVQRAIFDIQATLQEMNERDKLRSTTQSVPRLIDTSIESDGPIKSA